LFYTISGQESSSATVPPRYAFRLDDLRVLPPGARELPRLRAQGDRPERGVAAGAARLHAPDVARTAAALPELRGKGQGFARGGIPAA